VLAAYHAIGAFSETDFRDDLKKITVPALVVHGSDDQIVPLEISANLTAKLIARAKLVVYDRGSHGLLHVEKDRLNADLLAVILRKLLQHIGRDREPAIDLPRCLLLLRPARRSQVTPAVNRSLATLAGDTAESVPAATAGTALAAGEPRTAEK
jgi:hypothetical protein